MSNLIKSNKKVSGVNISEKIDTGLIFKKIIYKTTKMEIEPSYLKELANFEGLTNDEKKIMQQYMQLAEELNTSKVSEEILKLKSDFLKAIFDEVHAEDDETYVYYKNEENEKEEYLEEDVIQLINLFLIERRKEKAINEIVKKVRQGGLIQEDVSNMITSILNNQMVVHKNEIIDKFKETYNKSSKRYYESGIKYIDKHAKGFGQGNITTIIGNDATYNTIFTTQTAYKMLKEKVNVCLFSANRDSVDIASQFALKHFQELYPDESKSLSLPSIKNHNIVEEEKFWKAFKDFQENMNKYLEIVTLEQTKFNSMQSFRATLFEMDRLFKERTGKGIEVLIIDGIENLPFEKKWVEVQNSSVVLSNYMPKLKEEAKNFLNNNREIAVILTSCINNMSEKKKKGVRFSVKLDNIDKNIQKFSDVIITFQNCFEFWYTCERNYFNIFISKNNGLYLPDSGISAFIDLEKMTLKEDL